MTRREDLEPVLWDFDAHGQSKAGRYCKPDYLRLMVFIGRMLKILRCGRRLVCLHSGCCLLWVANVKLIKSWLSESYFLQELGRSHVLRSASHEEAEKQGMYITLPEVSGSYFFVF